MDDFKRIEGVLKAISKDLSEIGAEIPDCYSHIIGDTEGHILRAINNVRTLGGVLNGKVVLPINDLKGD